MGKVKLTQEQLNDINKALDFHGNVENLITAHKAMKLCGRQWMKYPALNDLTVTDLYAALNYGFQILPKIELNEQGKVKLPTKVAKAIEILCYEREWQINEVLEEHKNDPNGWPFPFSVLNGFDFKILKQALVKGYIKDDSFIPTSQKDDPSEQETSDNTQLEREDYMSLIDIALDNNDREWFKELQTKIRGGNSK